MLSCTQVEDSLSSKYTLYTLSFEFDRLWALSGGLSLLPALRVYYCVVAFLDLGLHSLFYGNSGAALPMEQFFFNLVSLAIVFPFYCALQTLLSSSSCFLLWLFSNVLWWTNYLLRSAHF